MSNNPEDIYLWPDDTWCYRHELEQYQHMSDDYLLIPYGSLFYPENADFSRSGFDGVTIIEPCYNKIVAARQAMMNKSPFQAGVVVSDYWRK
jgi:hypothetical protein